MISSKKSNRVLEIIEESSDSKTANGENLATVSEKELSNNRIRKPEGKVNKNSLSAQGQAETGGQGWQVQGRDVALHPEDGNLPMPEGYQESSVAAGANEQAQPVNLPGLDENQPQSQGKAQEVGLPLPEDAAMAEQRRLDQEFRQRMGEDPTLYDTDEDEE